MHYRDLIISNTYQVLVHCCNIAGKKKEEYKENKEKVVEKEEEESDDEMGYGLFGDECEDSFDSASSSASYYNDDGIIGDLFDEVCYTM